MLISRLMVIAILMGALSFTSCDKDDPVDEAKILIEYLESTTDPISWMPAIKSAEQVNSQSDGSYFVIDVRRADDYNAGHIEDAVNVSLSTIRDYFETNDLS